MVEKAGCHHALPLHSQARLALPERRPLGRRLVDAPGDGRQQGPERRSVGGPSPCLGRGSAHQPCPPSGRTHEASRPQRRRRRQDPHRRCRGRRHPSRTPKRASHRLCRPPERLQDCCMHACTSGRRTLNPQGGVANHRARQYCRYPRRSFPGTPSRRKITLQRTKRRPGEGSADPNWQHRRLGWWEWI